MSSQIYSVSGKVIDRRTQQGIPNLRVEAWIMRQEQSRSVGECNADENGRFLLCIDLKQAGMDAPPDLFFKVYRGTVLLNEKEDPVILQAGDELEVLIPISITVEHPEGKDRVNARQLFSGVNFLQQSDFSGVFGETKKKAGNRIGVIADMIMNTVTKMDIKPIRVSSTRETDVINQPVDGARNNLERQQIIVSNVLPYSPALSSSGLKEVAALPLNIKAGEKVNLYEENGKVRYYSVVKETQTSDTAASQVSIDNRDQLIKMKQELDATKENAARKDEEIAKLHDSLNELRKSHTDISNMLKPENLNNLFKKFQVSDKGKNG